MDQYEGRRYRGLKRHLTLSAVSYLFLAQVREDWRGEKLRADRVPVAYGDGGTCADVVFEELDNEREGVGQGGTQDRLSPAAQCQRPQEPHQNDTTKTTRIGHQAYRDFHVVSGTRLLADNRTDAVGTYRFPSIFQC